MTDRFPDGPGPQSSGALSRRQMLGVSGAAAVSASPVLRALDSTIRGEFRMVATGHRISFWLGGTEAWVVDTRRFGGKPVLSVAQSEGSIRIRLSGATYPGTSLPADLDVRLRKGVAGWRVTLKMPLGRFSASGSFERWLARAEPLRSRVLLKNKTVVLDEHCVLRVDGTAEATFTPDWVLTLQGDTLAALTGLGEVAHAESLSIQILSPDTPSVLNAPPARRTLFTLQRRGASWALNGGPLIRHLREGRWTLSIPTNAFDRINIETGESRTGRHPQGTRRALLAIGSAGLPALQFSPGARMVAGGGERATFDLVSPRLAIAFDAAGRDLMISARMAEPRWAHQGPVSMHLGPGEGPPEFCLRARDGAITSVRFEPHLLHTAVPLPGAVVLPVAAPTGSRVAFVHGTRRRGSRNGSAAELDISRQGGPFGNVPVSGITVVRADDLLVLFFELINLEVASSPNGPVLQATDPGQPSYLAVHFQFQHIGEQAFDEDAAPPDPLSAPPVMAEAAEETRLVFQIPSALLPLPYELKTLLEWSHYALNVAPLAVPPHGRPPETDPLTDQQPVVREPAGNETAIVVPYRLTLSPPRTLSAADTSLLPAFSHSLTPVTEGTLTDNTKLTELWHTRYALRAGGDIIEGEHLPDGTLTVRAIYSPDYFNRSGSDPFKMSLTPEDRYEIVALTTSFQTSTVGRPPEPYDPTPVDVYRLMLSSLGAWLDSNGTWDDTPPDPGLPLSLWRHQAAMGRDQYVRVAYKGRLFPFGHRAIKVTVTERRFSNSEGEIAYLFQQTFVIVKQPLKTYEAEDYPPPAHWSGGFAGRKMPFKTVQITTHGTPPLAGQENIGHPDDGGNYAFWSLVNGTSGTTDFLWHIVATDVLGQQSEFSMPLVFVPEDTAQSVSAMSTIVSAYLSPGNLRRRERDLSGQSISYVPHGPAVPGDDAGAEKDPSLKTRLLRFAADVPPEGTALPQGQPFFYPSMGQTSVFVPAIEHLVGQSESTIITYDRSTYLPHGFDAGTNKGQVWAVLKDEAGLDTSVGLAYGHGSSGTSPVTPGVASPNMTITALSAAHGPFGGSPDKYAAATFDPISYFSGAKAPPAKLLGGISLRDVLSVVSGDDFHTATPRLVTQKGGPASGTARVDSADETRPSSLQTKMHWQSKHLHSRGPFKVLPDPPPTPPKEVDTELILDLIYTIPKDPSKESSFELKGELKSFKLDFAALIVTFEKVTFSVGRKGQELHPSISNVEFAGLLTFLEDLKGMLAQDTRPYGFMDLQADHVEIGFNFPIPTITAGVFSLSKVSFSFGFKIPFFGDPFVFRFHIAEEDHHFLITIWVFGGGGYFEIELGLDGVRALDAIIEVGATKQFELGKLVSAGVKAMLGVHLHYQAEKDEVKLRGYLHLSGELDFGGIVTISLEIDFDLTYNITTKKLSGDASITFSVKVFLFSVSYHATAHTEFNSSSSHAFLEDARLADASPSVTIASMITDAQWAEYGHAFA